MNIKRFSIMHDSCFGKRSKNSPFTLISPMAAFNQEIVYSINISECCARSSLAVDNTAQVPEFIGRVFFLMKVGMLRVKPEYKTGMACTIMGPHQETIRNFREAKCTKVFINFFAQ